MKPFSLEEYLKNPSRKVITRDGKCVRIVCTDMLGAFPVIGLVKTDKVERALFYTDAGYIYPEVPSGYDLFFVPEIHEGWINVYSSSYFSTSARIFSSEEEAKKEGKKWKDYVATVKIEWET